MKRIMFFCIPAYGHHNPTLPVVQALVRRGNKVRYYSFEQFQAKIEATGAEFFACDRFMPEVDEADRQGLKNSSSTEMMIVDLQATAAMDSFMKEQVEEFKPDVIVSDSVCFWAKLTARKYNIPLVVSTTTFAFNRYSAQYMKSSFSEIKGLISGSKRVKAELKKLEKLGYHEKSALSLVQNDSYTDTLVYATKTYQPFSETFSKHIFFAGPSLLCDSKLQKERERPLVYVSLGTVVNDHPDFYRNCIEAFKDENMDVILSVGQYVTVESLGPLPEHIKAYPYVNQTEILSKASVFVSHCGMNSTSESLYFATPMVFFPQTNEQRAVARRAKEMGAGIELKDSSANGIRKAVKTILREKTYTEAAMACRKDFLSSSGSEGAAEFVEQAPHNMVEEDRLFRKREQRTDRLNLLYWALAVMAMYILPRVFPVLNWWLFAVISGMLNGPYQEWIRKRLYPLEQK